MTITAAIVMFAVIWFMALFIALPLGIRTQGESGTVVRGTHSSAPDDSGLKRKVIWVTLITIVIWAPACAFIAWGGVTIRDLDIWGRM